MTQISNPSLDKLIDSIASLRESVVRIEEAVKPIASMKKDLDELNKTVVEVTASAKSAHKRLDGHKEKIEEKPSVERVNAIDERVKKLEVNQRWVVTTIGAIIIATIAKFIGG